MNEWSDEECSSDDDEDDGRDDTGMEEEVATVASADSGKEETSQDEPSVIISKKKINLFRGYRFERVCQVCEKTGNTVKCRGPCAGVFHVECARGADNSAGQVRFIEEGTDKRKKRRRKKKGEAIETVEDDIVVKKEPAKMKTDVRKKVKIYLGGESDSDLDYADGEPFMDTCDEDAIMKMILGDTACVPEVSILNQAESEVDENEEEDEYASGGPMEIINSNISDFRCGDCAVFRTPLCFVCSQATDPSGEDSVRIRCSVGKLDF